MAGEDLLHALETLIGDVIPPSGNTAQISFVLTSPTIESLRQSFPREEANRSDPTPVPESDASQPPLPQPRRRRARGLAISMPKEELTPTSASPRGFFEDAWNSFWHVVFGILSVKIGSFTPIFLMYQLLDRGDINVLVDIGEFVLGQIVGWIFTLL